MTLETWATKWNIPPEILSDLVATLTATTPCEDEFLRSEADASNNVRIKASKAGHRLWRNNVGAGMMDNGSFVRFGLANDSKAVNATLKSSDTIGIKSGGQFYAREIKKPGWVYKGTDREKAQLAFITLINAMGGDAAFSTGEL